MVVEESESRIVSHAQNAISRANWEVGEAAARWIFRWSRGRADADFAEMVGLSQDHVFQRRRVWESFADVYQNYENLRWHHFAAAIDWKEAAECLDWANRLNATVSEMRAWHRCNYENETGN